MRAALIARALRDRLGDLAAVNGLAARGSLNSSPTAGARPRGRKTAASAALPPFISMRSPACTASGCEVATTLRANTGSLRLG